jgi:RNA polymerase sigma factor (sigma-70 family)
MDAVQAPPHDHVEVGLVGRAAGGDPAAFARLVERHQRDALAVAIGLLGERGEAEEAVQEGFVRAWKSLGTLREPGRFKAWLTSVLYRVCRDSIRARSRARRALSARAEEDARPLDPAASSVVDEAMQLPEEYREPLVLFYLQDLSVAELAGTLAITEDAAKVRLHRGRKLLRERLERKGL